MLLKLALYMGIYKVCDIERFQLMLQKNFLLLGYEMSTSSILKTTVTKEFHYISLLKICIIGLHPKANISQFRILPKFWNFDFVLMTS